MRKKILSVTLDDCEVQHFRSGGKGGQHQNKRDTGTRILHRPSGAVGESREQRSQLQNKKAAFKKMVESWQFKRWLMIQTMDQSPEELVEKEMRPENIKVEYRKGDKWEVQSD